MAQFFSMRSNTQCGCLLLALPLELRTLIYRYALVSDLTVHISPPDLVTGSWYDIASLPALRSRNQKNVTSFYIEGQSLGGALYSTCQVIRADIMGQSSFPMQYRENVFSFEDEATFRCFLDRFPAANSFMTKCRLPFELEHPHTLACVVRSGNQALLEDVLSQLATMASLTSQLNRITSIYNARVGTTQIVTAIKHLKRPRKAVAALLAYGFMPSHKDLRAAILVGDSVLLGMIVDAGQQHAGDPWNTTWHLDESIFSLALQNDALHSTDMARMLIRLITGHYTASTLLACMDVKQMTDLVPDLIAYVQALEVPSEEISLFLDHGLFIVAKSHHKIAMKWFLDAGAVVKARFLFENVAHAIDLMSQGWSPLDVNPHPRRQETFLHYAIELAGGIYDNDYNEENRVNDEKLGPDALHYLLSREDLCRVRDGKGNTVAAHLIANGIEPVVIESWLNRFFGRDDLADLCEAYQEQCDTIVKADDKPRTTRALARCDAARTAVADWVQKFEA